MSSMDLKCEFPLAKAVCILVLLFWSSLTRILRWPPSLGRYPQPSVHDFANSLGLGRAAISQPRVVRDPSQLLKDPSDFVSECEVNVSFARRWEAETVVEDMNGMEFEGSRLVITLSSPSKRPPPPQHFHSETVDALDKLILNIDEGREHFSTVMA